VLGYLNHFDTGGGDLVCSGALTPFKDGDRAAEVIYKAKAGVPWEASIDWAGAADMEALDENAFAMVNGREVAGPALIVRKWNLRGVAVCPYGADMNTESRVLSDPDKKVTVQIERRDAMTKKPEEAAVAAAVEPAKTVDGAEATAAAAAPEVKAAVKPEEAKPEAVKPEAAPDPRAALLAESKRFTESFGDQGAKWFLDGKTFEEAQDLRIKELEAENAELAKLAAPLGSEKKKLSTVPDDPDAVQPGMKAVVKLAKSGKSK